MGRSRRGRRPTGRLAPALATLAGVAAAVAALAVGPGRGPDQDAPTDRFLAGRSYVGTFPDPSVLRLDDGTYLAGSTSVANLNLGLMTYTDLVTWRPRPPLRDWSTYSTWPLYNEAMLEKPAWAATREVRDGKVALMSGWGASLARLGGRYLAAYSAAVTLSPRRSCIGIATAGDPLGQYADRWPTPLVCFARSPLGAIDPDVFVQSSGTGRASATLLWKQEGIPHVQEPRIVGRRLDAGGTRFAPGSRKRVLLRADQPWEAGIVENPSMVAHGGAYLLFYSGNAWGTASYATGYAVCRTPLGPCRKPLKRPLLGSTNVLAGPGGADAFTDGDGRLRLAYHAYDPQRVGPGSPRFLHLATLTGSRPDGLRVAEASPRP